MQVYLVNNIPKVKYEEIDKVFSPDKPYKIHRHTNGIDEHLYLSKEDNYRRKLAILQSKLATTSSDKIDSDIRSITQEMLKLGISYSPISAPESLETSRRITSGLTEQEKNSIVRKYSSESESSLKHTLENLQKRAEVKPDNRVKSPERPYALKRVSDGKQEVIYLSRQEKILREQITIIRQILREKRKRNPTNQKQSVRRYLFEYYTLAYRTVYYFPVHLATVLSIKSGREVVKEDALDIFNSHVSSYVVQNSPIMQRIVNSKYSKKDYEILAKYCAMVKSKRLEPVTFKAFCLAWITERCKSLKEVNTSTVDDAFKETLYDEMRSKLDALDFITVTKEPKLAKDSEG